MNEITKHNRDHNNMVGPVLRAGELADAAVEALEIDNPDQKFLIEDKIAYVRCATEGECIITRKTMEDILARPFTMQELETVLGSFAGQIEATQDQMRFYYNKRV